MIVVSPAHFELDFFKNSLPILEIGIQFGELRLVSFDDSMSVSRSRIGSNGHGPQVRSVGLLLFEAAKQGSLENLEFALGLSGGKSQLGWLGEEGRRGEGGLNLD